MEDDNLAKYVDDNTLFLDIVTSLNYCKNEQYKNKIDTYVKNINLKINENR